MMKEFRIEIVTNSLNESNDYLMKMWSVMLNYGKIGWHYRPYKSNSVIEFGDLSIHALGEYFVRIISKTRKTFSGVVFIRHDGEDFNESETEYFNNLVRGIEKIEKEVFIYKGKINIESQFGVKFLYPFQLEDISAYCIEGEQFIEFALDAYSRAQANELGFVKIKSVLDLLSIQINSHVKLEGLTLCNKSKYISDDIENLVQEDEDWIDEYPITNDHFILPNYAKEMFLKVMKDDDEVKIILKASHHFCNALGLSHKMIQEDLIISQLMSSIEVVTELNEYEVETCKECGQERYSIRKRVLDLIGNEMKAHMKKVFSDYYEIRSKYLHAGIIRSTRVYSGISLPQISDSSKSGCMQYPIKFELNLIEWVGWLLRKIMKERF